MKPVNGGAVKRNTTVDFELADGTTVPLTFTWACMMQIEVGEKDVYKRFSRAFMAGELMDGVLNVALSVYVAYLCGYIQQNGGLSGSLRESEFMGLIPDDFAGTVNVLRDIYFPKGAGDSGGRS